ncbi:MAG: NAD-dependent epimerase/dehydratase family protein [Polyangiaceae bacterium]|jgi:UDP-glucose 4-epimerase|nr:NAD-dependent epimerase/dehydratase family protein [Polyangiaceae bacterium]MBK8943330.1 NAD-dependent epimerase/dehydratase family protein [Polyangiaceae bacterium]
MKVLIPGIAGATGRVVALGLLQAGHEIIGLDRRTWPDAPDGVEMHRGDIRSRPAEDLFRTHQPEAVVHMATVTHLVARSEDRYRINLGGTRAVFEHSRRYGVKHVVFVGRHTYYGAGPESPMYHTEDEPPMAVTSFPELSDLVAADLYAGSALWRMPEMTTTVLRMVYTLGPTGHGTLASFLRGPRVPMILGFDPLYQFMHETDVARSIEHALKARVRGVYNVAGPPPVPLSQLIRATGRKSMPLPEFAFRFAMGRFGLPRLPAAALSHIKYPVVIDDRAFRRATGYEHAVAEDRAMREYHDAFPVLDDA